MPDIAQLVMLLSHLLSVTLDRACDDDLRWCQLGGLPKQAQVYAGADCPGYLTSCTHALADSCTEMSAPAAWQGNLLGRATTARS